MPARFAASLAALVALVWPASAEPVTGPRLRAEIAGNTLSGFNTSGVVFSEFHSPDGRILGHNNGTAVVDRMALAILENFQGDVPDALRAYGAPERITR